MVAQPQVGELRVYVVTGRDPMAEWGCGPTSSGCKPAAMSRTSITSVSDKKT